MTRLILRALNSPALALIGLIAVAIQTSLFSILPSQFFYFQPDFVLVLTLWCAFRREFTEGGVLVLILANIAEAHSATPQGYFMILYMAVYFLVRVAAKIFVIPNLNGYVTVALFASVFWRLFGLALMYLLGSAGNQWRHTITYLFPSALMQGFVAYLVFPWLEIFDVRTFKHSRLDQSLNDELRLGEADAEGY